VESVEIAYDHVGTALAAVVLSVFPWLHFVLQIDLCRIRMRCSSIWHEKLEYVLKTQSATLERDGSEQPRILAKALSVHTYQHSLQVPLANARGTMVIPKSNVIDPVSQSTLPCRKLRD
jgi:hypothetical protein